MKIKTEHIIVLGAAGLLVFIFREPIWQVVADALGGGRNIITQQDIDIAAQDEADALSGSGSDDSAYQGRITLSS